jgi:hypothetical protein
MNGSHGQLLFNKKQPLLVEMIDTIRIASTAAMLLH